MGGGFLDFAQNSCQLFRTCGLGLECKCSPGHAMVTVVIESQHLDWNVTCGRILLQVIKNGPSQHVRKENVEGNCRRMVLAGQCQSFGAPVCDQHLESLIAR